MLIIFSRAYFQASLLGRCKGAGKRREKWQTHSFLPESDYLQNAEPWVGIEVSISAGNGIRKRVLSIGGVIPMGLWSETL